MQHETSSLVDRSRRTLNELSENISTQDIIKATVKCGLSHATVKRYLNGDVRDLDTATSLIQFFRARISQREKLIA